MSYVSYVYLLISKVFQWHFTATSLVFLVMSLTEGSLQNCQPVNDVTTKRHRVCTVENTIGLERNGKKRCHMKKYPFSLHYDLVCFILFCCNLKFQRLISHGLHWPSVLYWALVGSKKLAAKKKHWDKLMALINWHRQHALKRNVRFHNPAINALFHNVRTAI